MTTSSGSSSRYNVGTYDRTMRMVLGVILLTIAIFSLSGGWATVGGLAGLILIGTAYFRFCPIYRLFGISTCPAR